MFKIVFLFLMPIMTFSQISLVHVDRLFEQKKYPEAEGVLVPYVANHTSDFIALERLGDAYGYQKKWDEAIGVYESLVEVDNNSANYHYKYAGVMAMKALDNKLSALGNINAIKYSFEKAASLDKNHIDVRWALVEFYMELPGILGGSIKKSLSYAQELEDLSKVDGYLAKGYFYEYTDEPELAEKYYKMAITEGGSIVCYDKLTKFYEAEAKPKKAIKNIEYAQKKHQRNALHYQIGKVAAEYNVELHKGEQCLHKYLINYSTKDGVPKAWAYYRLAQIQAHKNNKIKALKYINLAITALPEVKSFSEQKEVILAL